jgi:hypothetical protein
MDSVHERRNGDHGMFVVERCHRRSSQRRSPTDVRDPWSSTCGRSPATHRSGDGRTDNRPEHEKRLRQNRRPHSCNRCPSTRMSRLEFP